jgi:hypothetical protein
MRSDKNKFPSILLPSWGYVFVRVTYSISPADVFKLKISYKIEFGKSFKSDVTIHAHEQNGLDTALTNFQETQNDYIYRHAILEI